MSFDWPDDSIFIAAPREMSTNRFTQLVKRYLPKGDVVLGIASEEYVVGFEGQPQFRMLKLETVQPIIDKVETSNSPNKIYPFEYAQADFDEIAQRLTSKQRVLLVNGSWKYAFHNLVVYETLVKNNVPFKFVSPFVDEVEVEAYELAHTPVIQLPENGELLTQDAMFELADRVATLSYDYSFQTGATLGRKHGDNYEFIMATFNKVIPYQTYALHHGNSREKNRSRPHDINHYDTIHAEMMALTEAIRRHEDIVGTTMFIQLLPCPTCARTLSQTDISEIVYRHDHSDGYAVKLLEAAGKKVRRLVQ